MSDDAPFGEERPARRRFPLGWVGLVAVACAVYELTRSPALGSVLVCLKFGWEDFLAARWLWFNDPLPARRSATFWLYLAWGLWKTALVGFFLSVGFALVSPRAAPAGPADALLAFAGTFLLTFVALGLSAITTGLAVGYALRGAVRLWLDRAVHRARRHGDWPPTAWCRGNKNRLGPLLLTSLGFGVAVVLIAVVGRAHQAGVPGMVLGFAASVAAPVLLVVCREAVCRNVWADRPDECWPDAPEDWHEPPDMR